MTDAASVIVVAGNAPTLTDIHPGTVLDSDTIVRTNSFFFEDRTYLGPRVDLAFMGGDPRMAPFVFETLWRGAKDYQLHGWSTADPRVARAGRRRFRSLYRPMRYRDAEIAAEVAELCARYGRKPTTGISAMLMAHAMAPDRILLAGIDWYSGPRRYLYAPGRHVRDLLGADIGNRGPDLRLHHPDLDKAVIDRLQARGDVTLQVADSGAALRDLMEPAPVRAGTPVAVRQRVAPADLCSWAGLYPIALLKGLRHGSALLRRHARG